MQGWTALEKDTPALKGDAVISNGRLTAVIRRNGSIELYATAEGRSVQRAKVALSAAGGDPVAKFDKLALVEVTKGTIAVEVLPPLRRGAAKSGKSIMVKVG